MTTEQDQSTTEDRPNKAISSTTDRPIASGDGRSASFAVSGPDSPATDDSNDSGPYIDDIAPRRTRDFGDLTRAGLSLLMAAVVMVFAVYLGGMTRGVESDAHTAAQAINWLAAFPSTVLTQLATTVIVVIVLAQLLLAREWLQAAVSALAMFAGYGIVWVISTAISSLNDFTLPMALVSAATSYGSGLLPDIYAGMASFLTAAGPRRTRSTVKWSWNILYAIAAVMVVLSWHSVTGMLVSMAAGRTVGMLIRFVVGTQNKGVWGQDLVAALKGIGLDTASLIRHQEPGVGHGSLAVTLDDDLAEGSRIYDLDTTDNRRFIVSVIDAQTHTVGYLKQLWDWVRFTSVSIRRDRSVRDAVQHHFAMLLGLHNIKLPAPAPYGIADTDESAILVLDAHTIELPANLNTLTKADAVAYMRYLSVASRRGYTHRRITPDTLARLEDGTAVIAGWLNGDNASGPANTALDKVQLLVLFAALIGVEPAVEAARAELARATTNLQDTELFAPQDGVVLTRVHEIGAVVQGGQTVYTVTLNNPVWIRAYVTQPNLGNIRPGQEVLLSIDATPDKTYRGRIGFISPTAEFTPKTVETKEVRNDLVFRFRVIADDPDNVMRQGMPVTVTLRKDGGKP